MSFWFHFQPKELFSKLFLGSPCQHQTTDPLGSGFCHWNSYTASQVVLKVALHSGTFGCIQLDQQIVPQSETWWMTPSNDGIDHVTWDLGIWNSHACLKLHSDKHTIHYLLPTLRWNIRPQKQQCCKYQHLQQVQQDMVSSEPQYWK